MVNVKIIKTSSQKKVEDNKHELVKKKAHFCPQCGSYRKDIGYPMYCSDAQYNNCYWCECENCGTTWTVEF